MKTIKNLIQKSWLLIAAMLFLSSCYEFAFINQEKDTFVNATFQPEVCINVTDFFYDNMYFYPYYGMLIPKDWRVDNGFSYMKKIDGHLINIGQIYYSHKKSIEMHTINPPPQGYRWWVGVGKTPITSGGVYMTYPKITPNSVSEKYTLTYAIANSYSGLPEAVLSQKQVIYVVEKTTPVGTTVKAVDEDIIVKWKKPLEIKYLIGYDIFRNYAKINESLVIDENYVDSNPGPGSYSYSIKAVYIKGKSPQPSAPGRICYCSSGPSLQLDGENNGPIVLDDPSLQLDKHFTLEAWIKFDADMTKSPNSCPRIISKSSSGAGYELYMVNNGHLRNVAISTSQGTATSSTLLEADKWYHVAATSNGKHLSIFINGKLDAQKYISGVFYTSHSPLYVGQTGSFPFKRFRGNIDEVRIWNRARSDNQIQSNMSTLLSGNETGLVAYWNMNAGCDNFACDLSPLGNDVYLRGCCWDVAHYPHLPQKTVGTGSSISIPVLNYEFPVNNPQEINLVFKYNRNLFNFKGIELENTQLKKWDVAVHTNSYGVITINAKLFGTLNLSSDVLLYLEFTAKEANAEDYLYFNYASMDSERIRTQSGKLIAGNFYEREDNIAGKSSGLINHNEISLNLYPNPVQSIAKLNYSLNQDDHVTINIFNVNGQMVKSALSEYQNAGHQFINIDCNELASGVYFVTLKTSEKTHTTKMIIRK